MKIVLNCMLIDVLKGFDDGVVRGIDCGLDPLYTLHCNLALVPIR